MAERAEIFEVGPRDGLQNEPAEISVAQKVALINSLSQAGFSRIEIASFVSPHWVPQMAGSANVMAAIFRQPEVRYAALVPNMRGFEAAKLVGADEVAVFGAASEAFSKANINASIADSLHRFAPVAKAASDASIPLRGYVSCVTDCPFEGSIDASKVAFVAEKLMQLGCHEVSLGETLGRARPKQVEDMLQAVTQVVPADRLAGHFHDTGGVALRNIEVALGFGIRVFDAAIGGLGGCPYAPGAPGNVSTLAVHDHLLTLGFDTGLNRACLLQAEALARSIRTAAQTVASVKS